GPGRFCRSGRRRRCWRGLPWRSCCWRGRACATWSGWPAAKGASASGGSEMRNTLRTLAGAAWLGWQITSNWTDPWLFALYLLLKPLAGSLLLVCMYWAASAAAGGELTPGYLPFLYVSNACYMMVGVVTFGTSFVIISDREHYRMLKYIRI